MFYIIANPTSGRKKSNAKELNQIYDYLNDNKIEYRLFESQYYHHPYEIAKQITSEHESGDLIVIGGDGTFNEVLNGIKDLSKWNIGLIPTGSGNDFAKSINFSNKNTIECLKEILKKEVKPVDYIKVNDMVCANVLGSGIDVEVLVNFEKHTKMRGSFRYLYSLVETFFKFKWKEFDVSLDGGPFERKKGLVVTLCNGSHIGGGIPICPSAVANDGKLEFVFVKAIKKIKLPIYLIKLMSGKIYSFPETEHIYCQKAVFKDENNLQLQIDGNITNNHNEYRCEIIKEGINMYR